MAREVSNLGLDASNRYARDQDVLDKTLLERARDIPVQTQIDVTEPSYKSEFELLFALSQQQSSRALFTSPMLFEQSSGALFAFHVSGKIGGQEKQEHNLEKLSAYPVEDEGKKKEKESLIKCLNSFLSIEKQTMDIYALLRQYHKG